MRKPFSLALRPRDERGLTTKTLIILVALLAVAAVAYSPAKTYYEGFERKWAVASAADDGLAAVNKALQDETNPLLAASRESTEDIKVKAYPSAQESYCVRAWWVGAKEFEVEPAERGECE